MELHHFLLIIGGLLLIGLVTDTAGRRTRLPRVTLLIVFGVAIGQSGFDLLPPEVQSWYDFLSSIALTMVAFLLGGHLSKRALHRHGKSIFIISAMVVTGTALLVGTGLYMMGAPLALALLLGGIATATDPAATQDVVRQSGAKGPFTRLILGIVAVDDAWGLLIFSVLLVAAQLIGGEASLSALYLGLWEIGGAVLIGTALGLPAAYLTGRLRPGEPMQMEALGIVFLCAGLAHWLHTSVLLTGMVAGAVITNLARHHSRPFHAIEDIEWPFLVLFFVLAGASLQIADLGQVGLIGLGFILLRLIGRYAGGWLGAHLAGESRAYQHHIGLALIPQAGVALGMALVAAEYFPELKQTLLAVTIATTVIFEIVGPIMTQVQIKLMHEK